MYFFRRKFRYKQILGDEIWKEIYALRTTFFATLQATERIDKEMRKLILETMKGLMLKISLMD